MRHRASAFVLKLPVIFVTMQSQVAAYNMIFTLPAQPACQLVNSAPMLKQAAEMAPSFFAALQRNEVPCHSPRANPACMTANSAPTFEQALDMAPAFCAALQRDEAPDGLAEFVQTSAGARGFFVNYLTSDEWTCADASTPPSSLVASLVASPAEVIEIMLMNVVMSAGTEVAHRVAGRDDQASASARTCKRATTLINALWNQTAMLRTSYAALGDAILAELSDDDERAVEVADAAALAAVETWQAFLVRWQYNRDQIRKISDALALCGAPSMGGE